MLPKRYTYEADEIGLHYSGFWTKLDCDLCGGCTEVEGDVSNGEVYACDDCGENLEVWGR